MARWQPVPIVGGAYSDETKPWSAQDTVNYIPEIAERPQGRSEAMLRDAPGSVLFCERMEEAPVRGLHDVEGQLLAVTGRTLYRVETNGAATAIGVIPGVGRVSMAHNQIDGGHEVLIANGSSGYVYSTKTGALTQITDEGFPGMVVVDFVDGYLAGVEPSGRYWFHSDLRRATEYNTLDRQDAEAVPDRIVGLIVTHREVMVMGRRSGQFFRNTGAAQGTFQNANGTEMEVGLASPFAIARLDNTVYWLGNDAIVYRLNGNQPQRVSLGPIEQAIARCDSRKAYAFTFEDRGHKIFYLTFPDGHTWGYDVWTNEWHRRQSEGMSRWRLSTLVKSNGRWIGGDYANGRLYRLDWDAKTENGAVLDRRRVTGVLHDNQNAVTLNGLELVFATGVHREPAPYVEPPPPPLVLSGSAPDFEVGTEYPAFAYTQSGGRAPRVVSLQSGDLPPGLAIDTAGRLTGTPTEAGEFEFTLLLTDSNGQTTTHTDSILIHEEAETCALAQEQIGGVSFPTVRIIRLGRAAGRVTLTCPEQGIPDKVEVWVDGIKRADSGYIGYAGYQSDMNAYLDGLQSPRETVTVATEGQTFDFQFFKGVGPRYAEVRVWAPMPGTGWGFTLSCPDTSVVAGPLTLAGACPDPKVGYSTPYGYIAHGGKEPYTFSIASGALPPGRTLDPATGVVSGTYTTTGAYTFTVQVEDALGAVKQLSDSVNVVTSY